MAVFFELKLYGTEINIQIIIDTGFHFIGERIFIIIIITEIPNSNSPFSCFLFNKNSS